MSSTNAAGIGGRIARYRAALELAPAKARALPDELTRLDAIRRKLWAVPVDMSGINAVILDADPAQFEAALDEAAAEHARRRVAEAAIKAGAGAAIEQRVTKALARFLPELVLRVRPVFDAAAADLERVAPELPAGDAFADPAAVLASGREHEHRTALQAMAALTTLAAVHEVPAQRLRGSAVWAMVAPPAGVGPVVIHARTRVNVDPEAAERAGTVSNLLRAYTADPRAAMVDTARGVYPGCRFDLAANVDELSARIDAAEGAHRTRVATPDELPRVESPDTLGARRILQKWAASVGTDA